MRKLIFYPNLSKGGVSAVIRGRAQAEPDVQFDAVFLHDRGGSDAFSDMDNVHVRLVQESRSGPYLTHLAHQFDYESVSVLSHPASANVLSALDHVAVTYEFHSSSIPVIEKELGALELDRLAAVVVPSQIMAREIQPLLPRRLRFRLAVEPNLVDVETFAGQGSAQFLADSGFADGPATIPLLWIGRFDQGKAYAHFLRVIAALPQEYVGHVVVSLEDDPHRAERFFAEAAGLGVLERVRLYLNLTPQALGEFYRSVRDADGWLVSTSLKESFGYAVAEATNAGLRVAASDLPVWDLFAGTGLVHRVPSGSIADLVRVIREGAPVSADATEAV